MSAILSTSLNYAYSAQSQVAKSDVFRVIDDVLGLRQGRGGAPDCPDTKLTSAQRGPTRRAWAARFLSSRPSTRVHCSSALLGRRRDGETLLKIKQTAGRGYKELG